MGTAIEVLEVNVGEGQGHSVSCGKTRNFQFKIPLRSKSELAKMIVKRNHLKIFNFQHVKHDTIITARVRSTREGTVFTGVCLLTFRGGYPIQVWMVGGYPIPGLGGTPSQGGTPARSWWMGGTPSRGRGTPARSWWWGVPHPRGVPQPGLDGGGYLGYPPG